MPCFRPIPAFQLESGEIVFAERGSVLRSLEIACGQCVGCRLERSRVWAMRCVHEAQMHDLSSFVTLTYNEESCPVSLEYRDYQLFMKRLRKAKGPTRFYMCGEYGETNFRPHFHAILFGKFFEDRRHWKMSPTGFPLYRSELLERLWPHGHCLIGDVNFETAAYVARYCMKKVTGDAAKSHYTRLDVRTGELVEVLPEFSRMSLRPGIGATWFARYNSDVYMYDRPTGVMRSGALSKPPRYYKQLLERGDPWLKEYVDYEMSQKVIADDVERTPERLAVREEVCQANVKRLARDLQ